MAAVALDPAVAAMKSQWANGRKDLTVSRPVEGPAPRGSNSLDDYRGYIYSLTPALLIPEGLGSRDFLGGVVVGALATLTSESKQHSVGVATVHCSRPYGRGASFAGDRIDGNGNVCS